MADSERFLRAFFAGVFCGCLLQWMRLDASNGCELCIVASSRSG
jgi:hypothetical protein